MTNKEWKDTLNQQQKPQNGDLNYTQPDRRLKLIYERYHLGRTLTLDDLRYLWQKDPEACEKLAKNIIEIKSSEEQEKEEDSREDSSLVFKSQVGRNEQQYIDFKSEANTPVEEYKKAADMIASLKAVIENMSESDQIELSEKLNEVFGLEKLSQQMKYWDDEFTDKLERFTYETEKEFNILA